MYDSERDRDNDLLVDEFELDEADRIADIFIKHADAFMIAEDLEYIIAEMGGN